MGAAHAAVLAALGQGFTVVANGRERAEALAAGFGQPFADGGIEGAARARGGYPDTAVVALPVDRLAAAAAQLVQGGTRHILLEKPGGLNLGELAGLDERARAAGARIALAYNRRFMASTLEARRRIAAAGGALSAAFEFTEIGSRIPASTPAAIKERWALANSSHVVDLAFHLCGEPVALTAEHGGAGVLDWHPAAAHFRGFGSTDAGTAFSYLADWRGPGRWWVEIVLPTERLVMRPLERLQVVPAGRFEPEPVELDDALDRAYKPGLHAQMQAFLEADPRMLDLSAHVRRLRDRMMPMWGYGD